MIKKIILLFSFLFLSMPLWAGNFESIIQLARRRIPWLASDLSFEEIPANHGQDIFELSSRGGRIIIKANNVNSAATGLNWYLEYYCHRSMSHLGDNLSPVYPLPQIKNQVKIISPFKYRYALNYCTLNYTMSFYNWKDWQWELDWMALHGVNLMLATIGTEAVWQRTLEKFGFTDKEIKDFIPGPGFNAWWLMGNLEGWGGPITQRMIDRRTYLEQQILKRMQELGIQPVLQGFYGMVPRALKNRFPKSAILAQGKWVGAFERPDMLLPEDSLFSKMAGVYYDEIKELYGKNIHFFGGDPFHEGGITKGVNLTREGELIQKDMQKSFRGSTWVLQGWWENPRRELLEGLDKSKVLVLELAGEQSNDWDTRHAFEHTPFIWCTVNNFGGRSGLYGKLQFFADEVDSIRSGPYKDFCKGVGIMPEGIRNNPVVYDLMLELGWHTKKISVKDWIKNYVYYRYGSKNDTLEKAWQLFLNTVYRDIPKGDSGLPGDIFCARPAWGLRAVSTGNLKRNYSTDKFDNGVKLFLSVGKSFSENKTYQIDLVDFLRQEIADKGNILYNKMGTAYSNKDSIAFLKCSDQFLNLILLDDSLLGMKKEFGLNLWLNEARQIAKTPYERKLSEWNARTQITYWGPNNPSTGLHDYANRDWSGLMRTFYFIRWQKFINYSLEKMRGETVQPFNFYDFEYKWAHQQGLMPVIKLSNREKNNIMLRALNFKTTL